jgi:hypothetical protein
LQTTFIGANRASRWSDGLFVNGPNGVNGDSDYILTDVDFSAADSMEISSLVLMLLITDFDFHGKLTRVHLLRTLTNLPTVLPSKLTLTASEYGITLS